MRAIPMITLGLAAWLLPYGGGAAGDPVPTPRGAAVPVQTEAQAQAQAKTPVWEVQFRLDGGGDATTAALFQTALEAAEVKVPFTKDTVIKLAMSDAGVWYGQARGSFDAGELLRAAAEKGGTWEESGGVKVLLMQEEHSGLGAGSGTVALASAKRGEVVAASAAERLGDAMRWAEASKDEPSAWLSGRIDLQRLEGEEPRSRLLRLVKDLSFSVSTVEGDALVSLQGGFADPITAGRAVKILEGSVALLSADAAEGQVPLDERLEVKVEGSAVQTHLRLKAEELAFFFQALKSEMSLEMKSTTD